MISQKELCIGFTQENLIEFLIQCIYLIYTKLIVHAIQVLAYSKNHAYYILLFQNILCSSVWYMIVWFETVIYNLYNLMYDSYDNYV